MSFLDPDLTVRLEATVSGYEVWAEVDVDPHLWSDPICREMLMHRMRDEVMRKVAEALEFTLRITGE